MTIRNGLKRTISTSGRFELLQIISESNIKQSVNEDASPQERWIVRTHVKLNKTKNIKQEHNVD